MQNFKNSIHEKLIITGRNLVMEKGSDFLTARKLSDTSDCSIGTIYNQFSSMDDFIAEQNEITLSELYGKLISLNKKRSAYENLNNYVDGFVSYVLDNQQLWFLLYHFHLNNKNYKFSVSYKKIMLKLFNVAAKDMTELFNRLDKKRLKLTERVLWLSIVAQSSMLAANILDDMGLVNKNNLSKLLLNTYLAGIMVLNKD
jgi:AcrR family transcriptional regulator